MLDIVFDGTCGSNDVLSVVRFFLKLLDIVYILVPVGLILFITIDFGKNVISKDESEMSKRLSIVLKRVLMCLLMFLVPFIVDFTIGLLGNSGNGALSCLAEARSIETPVYKKLFDAVTGNVFHYGSSYKKPDVTIVSPDSGNNSRKHSSYDSTIFIGDSRTVIMCGYVDLAEGEDCEIALSGSEIIWFEETAIPALKAKLADNPKVNVVIMMGTNDVLMGDERRSTYASLYNDLISQYKDTNFVIVSVTQVDDGIIAVSRKSLFNSDIREFNDAIKSGLNDKSVYCDVYSDIDGKVVTASDGIHYEEETSKLIYDSIHKCL